MTNQMTHIEANILAENGFTVDASLKYATAKFNSRTYTVYFTGLHSPWRITCKIYHRHQPSIYNFKTFYDVMEFIWGRPVVFAHREKAFSAIV